MPNSYIRRPPRSTKAKRSAKLLVASLFTRRIETPKNEQEEEEEGEQTKEEEEDLFVFKVTSSKSFTLDQREMALSSKLFIATNTLLALLACIYGQGTSDVKVSQTCLGCICEAASGCNTTLSCDGQVCGPFRITWAYWADGGKPTLNNEPNTNDGAYARCVNDPYCASRAVEGYMQKFQQDCNGDGAINCDDFVRIHRQGAYACSGPLDAKYEGTYKLCMQTFG